jgi:hypothetical protein
MLIGKATTKDLNRLWLDHKEHFMKCLAIEQNNKSAQGKGELERRFIDSNGRSYFAYGKNSSLPIERLGKLMEYMQWMSAGLTSVELDKLLDAMDKAIMAGLKTGKNAARIGAILEEIRLRKKMVIHHELLYNYLAVQWIRDDENPLVFNNQIQLEKVEQFKIEVSKSNAYFFFQNP